MSAVYFILLLGGLIFFHELGHFVVAKLSGVRVLTFSIGFGPAILSKRWGDTLYKLAAVPLGGYVRMYGDEPDAVVPKEEQAWAFNYKPLWKRTLIVLAGPVSNLLLPFIVFFFVFLSHTEVFPPYLGSVTQGGPAWEAGLRPGDVVTRMNGEEIDYWWQLEAVVNGSIGKEIEVAAQRGGEVVTARVVPEPYDDVIEPRMNLTERVGRILVSPWYVEPIVSVSPGSRAEQAGLADWDRVLSVDDAAVKTYAEFESRVARPGAHTLKVSREKPAEKEEPAEVDALELPLEGGGDLGLADAEMVVHEVDDGSAAAGIGLTRGDRILSVDGELFPFWSIMETYLSEHVKEEHKIVWWDGKQKRSATFSLKSVTEKGEFNEERKVVVFGARNQSSQGVPDLVPNRAPVAYAVRETWNKTIGAYWLTVASIGGLLTARLPVSDMGGPVLIYQMASKTEQHGWEYFFTVMVLLSISLGVINLFPIPILDGGHLLFFAIEAVIRRPVSLKIGQYAAYVGLAFIVALMVVVFSNDIMRNWDGIAKWF